MCLRLVGICQSALVSVCMVWGVSERHSIGLTAPVRVPTRRISTDLGQAQFKVSRPLKNGRVLRLVSCDLVFTLSGGVLSALLPPFKPACECATRRLNSAALDGNNHFVAQTSLQETRRRSLKPLKSIADVCPMIDSLVIRPLSLIAAL